MRFRSLQNADPMPLIESFTDFDYADYDAGIA
jgi:hypothetical protein